MSLTVYLDTGPSFRIIPARDTMSLNDSHESTGAEYVWDHFRCLPAKIQTMKMLTTFSFTISIKAEVPGWHGRSLAVAQLIQSLPETCSSLEIDTRGLEFDQDQKPGEFHFCNAIRAMMPRLRHLRLRVSMLCPNFCGEHAAITGSAFDMSHFKLTAAPNLDTLVVNCMPHSLFRDHVRLCRTNQQARPLLTECLQALVKQNKYPNSKRFYILDSQAQNDPGHSIYAAFNRRDVVQNITWTIPFRQVTTAKDSFLTRMPDGGEYLSDLPTIEQLAEGGLWQETMNGIRLPNAVLAERDAGTAGRTLRHIRYESSRDWRARNPKKSCTLWRNETLTGVTLLGAERRDGLSTTLPLAEKTPPGWVRDGWDLKPEEDTSSS
ncbi:hypothetical protein MMC26_002945 [Xylographa opegraphella]|nr:hypothetical protein [Xylographa opegraphella]